MDGRNAFFHWIIIFGWIRYCIYYIRIRITLCFLFQQGFQDRRKWTKRQPTRPAFMSRLSTKKLCPRVFIRIMKWWVPFAFREQFCCPGKADDTRTMKNNELLRLLVPIKRIVFTNFQYVFRMPKISLKSKKKTKNKYVSPFFFISYTAWTLLFILPTSNFAWYHNLFLRFGKRLLTSDKAVPDAEESFPTPLVVANGMNKNFCFFLRHIAGRRSIEI